MMYKVPQETEERLLRLGESGIGYQVIEAESSRYREKQLFLVLNAELLLPLENNIFWLLNLIKQENYYSLRACSELIELYQIRLLASCELPSLLYGRKQEYPPIKWTTPQPASQEEHYLHILRILPFADRRQHQKGLLIGSLFLLHKEVKYCCKHGLGVVNHFGLSQCDNKMQVFHYYLPVRVLEQKTILPLSAKNTQVTNWVALYQLKKTVSEECLEQHVFFQLMVNSTLKKKGRRFSLNFAQ